MLHVALILQNYSCRANYKKYEHAQGDFRIRLPQVACIMIIY